MTEVSILLLYQATLSSDLFMKQVAQEGAAVGGASGGGGKKGKKGKGKKRDKDESKGGSFELVFMSKPEVGNLTE